MESPCGQRMESSLKESQCGFEPPVALPEEEREKTHDIILSFSTFRTLQEVI